jgi:hypothetical protein
VNICIYIHPPIHPTTRHWLPSAIVSLSNQPTNLPIPVIASFYIYITTLPDSYTHTYVNSMKQRSPEKLTVSQLVKKYSINICFNIILPSNSWPFKLYLSFKFPAKTLRISVRTWGFQRSSSLCNFLQPPVTFDLSDPKISSSAPCSGTHSTYGHHLCDESIYINLTLLFYANIPVCRCIIRSTTQRMKAFKDFMYAEEACGIFGKNSCWDYYETTVII